MNFFIPTAYATTLPLRTASETIVNLSGASPARAINDLYTFALGIGAMVAFGIIVYAAFRYATSESSSTQSEAKTMIYQALLGLLLLLGVTLVLGFINPDLPNLRDPNLRALEEIKVTTSPLSGPCPKYSKTGTAYWTLLICPTGSCTMEDYCAVSEQQSYATEDECKTAAGNLTGDPGPNNEHWLCSLRDVPPPIGGTAGGQCTVLPDGPGSPAGIQAALTGRMANCFGDKTEKASGVANVESRGNVAAKSGTDGCSGDPVSIGLFQINLTVNPLYDSNGQKLLDCPKAFSDQLKTVKSVCQVTNRTLYNECVTLASDPRVNTASACVVFRYGPSSFKYWGQATKDQCGI